MQLNAWVGCSSLMKRQGRARMKTTMKLKWVVKKRLGLHLGIH